MKLTVEIVGLKGVEDALSEAGPKLAKRALRKALVAGADLFKAAAKKNAPVLAKATPNRRPDELRDAIDMTVKLSGKQESGVARVGIRRDKGKGSQSPAVWGSFVEFGSIHGAAQPFMRPAFEQAKTRAQEVFPAEISKAVEILGK
jgi:HK97 gp10 family phage protein